MPTKADKRPRVGVPWRTVKQERAGDTRYNRDYLQAVKDAGGNPVQVSLVLPKDELTRLAATLDGFVLPGSPADVDPTRYGSKPRPETAPRDAEREQTDIALLQTAISAGKPVLAICYGAQLLNVHLGGTLVQDISSQLHTDLKHEPDSKRGEPVSIHPVRLKSGWLAKLARRATARVNSSHHQSILRPGRGLRVTAHAPDGVVEGIEWTNGPAWVVGVQWHPERMCRDAKRSRPKQRKSKTRDVAFAKALFSRLVVEARAAAKRRAGNLRRPGALHVKSEATKRRRQ